MTNSTKFNEPQFWQLLMVVVPLVVCMNLGNALTDHAGLRILIAGATGGAGALLGWVAYYFTKDKGRGVKIAATLALLAASIAVVWMVATRKSDEKIVEQPWKPQSIGAIAFATPELLDFRSSDVPDPLKGVYSSMNMYTLEEKDRLILFLQSELTLDSLRIQEAFDGALFGMLQPMGVGKDDIMKEPIGSFEHAVAYRFSFTSKGKELHGFGCLYSWGQFLESVWLMPKTAGFSDAYIDKFIAALKVE